jgi:2-amino-4-hydroxy-6-hydroxymethyldihydropteridine diphosphokinase
MHRTENGMIRYIVGIGSNLDPYTNVVLILKELLTITSEIQISRIIETTPIGMQSNRQFLNFSASFMHVDEPTIIKARFNAIERTLGRDRDDPLSSVKDRPADLDIVLSLNPTQDHIQANDLPNEPYLRPTTIDLLKYLGITILGEEFQNSDEPGVKILTSSGPVGQQPMTLYQHDI